MRPDDSLQLSVPQRDTSQTPPRDHEMAHQAAADLTRQQIDTIYHQQAPAAAESVRTPPVAVAAKPAEPQNISAEPANTYLRTHQAAHTIQAAEWQKYHSAWQQYYQKYYEKYYVGATTQLHQAYNEHAVKLQNQMAEATATATAAHEPETEQGVGQDEAMYDLRTQIVSKVQESGRKVRRSRHFMPAIAALSVLLLFTLLQFNRVIIANVQAYITPGEIDPQNIVIDPAASNIVGQKSLLIIPKINVSVPIIWENTMGSNNQQTYDRQMAAMKKGVAYFAIPGANSKPGQVGNTVIAGHSSNDFIDSGNYKFVFALLERMKKGDVFYVNYKGIRYTYSISRIRVVLPNDVNSLTANTTAPEVTLLTCTPLGTALKRLLVTGTQISPDPIRASAAPTKNTKSDKATNIPGNSPTFFERIFGTNNN